MSKYRENINYPTRWQLNIAIEQGHFQWSYPLKRVMFNSYVRHWQGLRPPRTPCATAAGHFGCRWNRISPSWSMPFPTSWHSGAETCTLSHSKAVGFCRGFSVVVYGGETRVLECSWAIHGYNFNEQT